MSFSTGSHPDRQKLMTGKMESPGVFAQYGAVLFAQIHSSFLREIINSTPSNSGLPARLRTQEGPPTLGSVLIYPSPEPAGGGTHLTATQDQSVENSQTSKHLSTTCQEPASLPDLLLDHIGGSFSIRGITPAGSGGHCIIYSEPLMHVCCLTVITMWTYAYHNVIY